MRWLCKTAAEILFFCEKKRTKKEMFNLDSKTANYCAKMAKILLAYFLLNWTKLSKYKNLMNNSSILNVSFNQKCIKNLGCLSPKNIERFELHS